MLSSMARRPPTHVHHMNGLHHQPYQSKPHDEDDDNEEERDVRRARSRILANKLSESLLHRSSTPSTTMTTTTNKEDSIEQRIKNAIDICDIDALRDIYCQSSSSISIERRFKSGGWTALIHAAYSCHSNLVSLFVTELGANVNTKGSDDMSPLMACCMSSHSRSSTNHGNEEQLTICRFLLEHGAQIEPELETNHDKIMTPLMLAARFGCSPPLIHLLAQYGAKIDRRDAKGWCPLIMAAQHGHLGSVEALIQSGANVESTTNNGLTALDIAQHSKHDAIVQFLRSQQTSSVSLVSSNEQSHSISRTISHEKKQVQSVNTAEQLLSNDQSWKSIAYMSAATAVGGALLVGLAYMRR